MVTPVWSAARNGLPGDTNAVDQAAQINQLLGTHDITAVWTGEPIVTPDGTGAGSDDPANFWNLHMDSFDYDQPFTMSGTQIGRVQIPMLLVGDGADVKVSLCNDSAGVPGTVIASTVYPASWIRAFSQVVAVPTPAASVFLADNTGPLTCAQFNPLHVGAWFSQTWQSPAVGSDGGGVNPSGTQSGDWVIFAGGKTTSGAGTSGVFTVNYPGSGFFLGDTTPQPSLPVSLIQPGLTTTSDSVVVAGGINSAGTDNLDTVFVASWDSSSGIIGAWSTQQVLPEARDQVTLVSSGQTVYVIAGEGPSPDFASTDTVFYGTIDNGQITTWNSGPSLPIPLFGPQAAVLDSFVVVFGGLLTGNVPNGKMFYAHINDDGSLDDWQTGPDMPQPVDGFNVFTSDTGIIQVGGVTDPAFDATDQIASITFDQSGPGVWQTATFPFGPAASGSVGFTIGVGQSQLFWIFSNVYEITSVYTMPYMSVPLPVTGLTNGQTYHVLIQQQGGDSIDYVRMCSDFHALPGNPTLQFRQRGSTGAWSNIGTGFCIPITVYDQTQGVEIIHTWEDSGSRTSTIVYASTPDHRILGIADGTRFLDGTTLANVTKIDYPGTWPGAIWPLLGATQVS